MLIRRVVLSLFGLSLLLNCAFLLARFDWLCVPALIAGWFLADAASGVVHMVMDYHPCPEGVGLIDIFDYPGSRESAHYLALRQARMARLTAFQRVVFDFKTHHPRPDALGRRSLWHQIGTSLVVGVLPASLALSVGALYWPTPGWVLALGLTAIIGTGFAQYFHGSLHQTRPSAHIVALRRMGLLMQPAAHQLHHDSLQRDFATNCGWSNPVLNPLFRALRSRGLLEDAGLEPRS